MPCDVGAVFKGVEFVLCVVCLVYKRYTDNEAIRVFYHLEKLSREWPLLNNITWDENGALLADITFGAFAIITLGLLIAQLTGELRRVRRLVCFYLVLGCIMFLVVGGLCLAAVDQVPHHLLDNAIVLGVLSILTGLLFLLDLATTGNKKQSTTTTTQDKKPYKVTSVAKPVDTKKVEETKKETVKEADDTKAKKNTGNGVLKELRSSFKKKKTVEDLDGRGVVVEKNEREKVVEFEPENNDKLDNRLEQSGDEFRQYGRRKMDNRGFARAASDDSGRFSNERFRGDFVDAERDRWLDREADHSGARDVSTGDAGRSRPTSMLEVEMDEHYLRPKDYHIEKRVKEEREFYLPKEERRGRDVQDQRVTSSRHDMSDDEYQQQLPSVSFLISERGRKVLPSVKSSPVERLHEVTSSSASAGVSSKPRYYFNSARDPASGSSAPPSPQSPTGFMAQDSLNPRTMTQDSLNPSYTARTPGYVLHTASQWDDPDKHPPSNVTDRIQHWFRNRQPGKNP